MTPSLVSALRQIRDDLADRLEPLALAELCRSLGCRWRDRILNPVTTIHLFVLQILHCNTACARPAAPHRARLHGLGVLPGTLATPPCHRALQNRHLWALQNQPRLLVVSDTSVDSNRLDGLLKVSGCDRLSFSFEGGFRWFDDSALLQAFGAHLGGLIYSPSRRSPSQSGALAGFELDGPPSEPVGAFGWF